VEQFPPEHPLHLDADDVSPGDELDDEKKVENTLVTSVAEQVGQATPLVLPKLHSASKRVSHLLQ